MSDVNSIPASRTASAYGWVIVVVAALAMVATLPGRTHGLGMITERLLKDEMFHLNPVRYSDINLAATLLGGLFCLPCGWLIDRFGLRFVVTGSLIGLTAAVLAMTKVQDVQMLSLMILFTRGFGQSALSVVSITMVGKWFRGRLSLPMAIYSLLLSLGFAYAAQLAKPWAHADWRVVWNGIGYSLLGFIPLACLLTRDPHEDIQTTDGDSAACCSNPESSSDGYTLSQAIQTQAFWVFGLAISLVALIGSGQSLFNESVLKKQGFPTEVFYDLVTFSGLVGMLTKLPVGWMGQHFRLNRMLAAGMAMQSFAMMSLPMIHTKPGIYAYGTVMGISGTITTVLFFTVWGQVFGRAHLGRIQSISQMMTVLASSLGPRVFAECLTRFGNYNFAFLTLAAFSLMIAVWSFWLRMPSPTPIPHAPTPEAVPQET
jgi:MFS family permease